MVTAGPERTQRTTSSSPMTASSTGNRLLPCFSSHEEEGVDMSSVSRGGFSLS